MSTGEAAVNDQKWLLPKRLRRGLREALDGGRGRLRMDPEDLAELIGKAIDMEIDRLARIRAESERRRKLAEMLRQPESYFRSTGERRPSTESGKRLVESLFQKEES